MQRLVTKWLNISKFELIYQLQTWDFSPSIRSREGSNWNAVSETSYPPPHINHCYLPSSSCSSPDYFVSPFAECCSERQAENGKEKVNLWLKVQLQCARWRCSGLMWKQQPYQGNLKETGNCNCTPPLQSQYRSVLYWPLSSISFRAVLRWPKQWQSYNSTNVKSAFILSPVVLGDCSLSHTAQCFVTELSAIQELSISFLLCAHSTLIFLLRISANDEELVALSSTADSPGSWSVCA